MKIASPGSSGGNLPASLLLHQPQRLPRLLKDLFFDSALQAVCSIFADQHPFFSGCDPFPGVLNRSRSGAAVESLPSPSDRLLSIPHYLLSQPGSSISFVPPACTHSEYFFPCSSYPTAVLFALPVA